MKGMNRMKTITLTLILLFSTGCTGCTVRFYSNGDDTTTLRKEYFLGTKEVDIEADIEIDDIDEIDDIETE